MRVVKKENSDGIVFAWGAGVIPFFSPPELAMLVCFLHHSLRHYRPSYARTDSSDWAGKSGGTVSEKHQTGSSTLSVLNTQPYNVHVSEPKRGV